MCVPEQEGGSATVPEQSIATEILKRQSDDRPGIVAYGEQGSTSLVGEVPEGRLYSSIYNNE
uniref:Uncharacterized protein n=1 Tax=Thermosporothrix sp. COM3 TaxID=2490863 RepID=A0A455SML6_9CHLR|nr:hypothetical protein KTC_29130 [Thermosporothrix sp. COM3]